MNEFHLAPLRSTPKKEKYSLNLYFLIYSANLT
jgi:hypothetical protein